MLIKCGTKGEKECLKYNFKTGYLGYFNLNKNIGRSFNSIKVQCDSIGIDIQYEEYKLALTKYHSYIIAHLTAYYYNKYANKALYSNNYISNIINKQIYDLIGTYNLRKVSNIITELEVKNMAKIPTLFDEPKPVIIMVTL